MRWVRSGAYIHVLLSVMGQDVVYVTGLSDNELAKTEITGLNNEIFEGAYFIRLKKYMNHSGVLFKSRGWLRMEYNHWRKSCRHGLAVASMWWAWYRNCLQKEYLLRKVRGAV